MLFRSFKLYTASEINGVELKPGDYQGAFADNSATFYRNGKEVAKAAARSEEVPTKFTTSSVVYQHDDRTLTEIRFEGSNKKLVLEGATAKARGAKATSGAQN